MQNCKSINIVPMVYECYFFNQLLQVCENHVYLYFIPGVTFSSNFLHAVTFYMFFTLMSLKDRLRLKLKVKTQISLCMAIMLDNPWQSLYTQYYRTV